MVTHYRSPYAGVIIDDRSWVVCALDFERKHHVDDPTVHDTSHYVWVTSLCLGDWLSKVGVTDTEGGEAVILDSKLQSNKGLVSENTLDVIAGPHVWFCSNLASQAAGRGLDGFGRLLVSSFDTLWEYYGDCMCTHMVTNLAIMI